MKKELLKFLLKKRKPIRNEKGTLKVSIAS